MTIILRRCEGNKRCWLYEVGSGYMGGTDYDLGRLIERAFDTHGPEVEFVLKIDPETEAEARAAQREHDTRLLQIEIDGCERALRQHRAEMKRLAKAEG